MMSNTIEAPSTHTALAQRHADLLAQLTAAEREARATHSIAMLPGGTLQEFVRVRAQLEAATPATVPGVIEAVVDDYTFAVGQAGSLGGVELL